MIQLVYYTGVNLNVLFLTSIVVVVAIVTKLVGCALPAMIFPRGKSKSLKVGIGMISRGEVGLIVTGIGVVYTTVIIMVAVTTMITPVYG
jgi:Kef-type K+ transport system membrane component KefB